MARQSLLEKSPAIAAAIIRSLRRGHSQARSCRAAGVPLGTFEEWLDQGRNNPKAKPCYKKFAAEVDAAFDVGIVHLEALAEAHALGDPKMVQWLLARRDPENYGTQKTIHIGGVKDGEPIRTKAEPTVNFDGWPPEDIELYIALHERNGATVSE